jgi:ketosteroid isomerase-like protein
MSGMRSGMAGFVIGVAVASGVGAGLAARGDAAADVRRADTDFAQALAARDQARFRTYLADDVVFFRPGLIRGGDAFVEGWTPFFAGDGPQMTFGPIEAAGAASGDLGYTIGWWRRSQTGHPASQGHYVTIWKRQRDGRFRAVVDIGTVEPEPPQK